MKEQKEPSRKKSYKKVGFDLKLLIIDQIQNGRISVNYAAKKYDISKKIFSRLFPTIFVT